MRDIHLQEKDGFYYFSCGAVINEEGERKHKKHTLGKDYKLAMRKAEALSLAWDAETTVDLKTGLTVWSAGSIEAALRFATEAATQLLATRYSALRDARYSPVWPFAREVAPFREYPHVATAPAETFEQAEVREFLLFCLRKGIVCANIKRANFRRRSDGLGLLFVDVGEGTAVHGA